MESMAAQTENFALIRVVGVGGAGSNAVNRMIRAELLGVEFIAVNTDAQALVKSHAPTRIRIGDGISRGLGAGGDSAVGERAAQEDIENLRAALEGSDLVFVTAGMGGGTGSGAAPVVAKIAKEIGALTIGIVTKPFVFEGKRRAAVAEAAANELRKHVDTLIVIPNERLLSVVSRQTSMEDSFRIADDVLRQAVKGVSDVITVPGIINLDFADVRSIMRDAGSALMGIGRASGENRATSAAEIAIASPLLEVDIQGATGVLINVAASATVTLHEVNEAINHITARADDEANIIFGTSLDESLGDEIQITVIATGFSADRQGSASSPRAPYRATESGAWSLRDDGVAVQEASAPSFTYTPTPEPAPVAVADAADAPLPVVAPQPEEVESGDLDIPAFLRPRKRIF
ncbi:MAG: cell division protein FtsZ [Chloroflexi bacterium]|jgi:cell division protein FtsZ|nr:MAG: cell division protein FtsZ [Chloroflexota bacterium]